MIYSISGARTLVVMSVVMLGSLVAPQVSAGQVPAVSSPPAEACPRSSGDAQPAQALDEAIKLSPKPKQEQALVNFGTDRGRKAVTYIFFADKPLPTSITPATLEMIADPMLRSSDTLETADFPRPSFSEPRIQANRSRIEIDACLNPAGVDAGKYTTTITLGGPVGINSATVGLTANLKSGSFWIMLLVTLVIALGLLIVQQLLGHSPRRNLKDARFWVATTISLAGATIIMWKIWDADPTWGANSIGAFVALSGAAFAAIGAQSITKSLLDASKKE